jgi:hypothetical protein
MQNVFSDRYKNATQSILWRHSGSRPLALNDGTAALSFRILLFTIRVNAITKAIEP